jgi:hypothetical protein
LDAFPAGEQRESLQPERFECTVESQAASFTISKAKSGSGSRSITRRCGFERDALYAYLKAQAEKSN